MSLEFKYQTLFTCKAPEDLFKDFTEIVATDKPMDADELAQIINFSFEKADVKISQIVVSNNLDYCDVSFEGQKIARIQIRCRPSLVVGDKIFKLEDFDI